MIATFLECMLVLICKTQPEFIQHLRNFDGPRQTQRETAEPARKPRPGPPRFGAGDMGIAERMVDDEGGEARTGGGGDVALGVEVWRLGLMAATKSGAGARRRRRRRRTVKGWRVGARWLGLRATTKSGVGARTEGGGGDAPSRAGG